jgi:hypothetical protein
MHRNHQSVPPNAGAVIATTLLHAAKKQLPSSQEKRGDKKLNQARQIVNEFISVIAEIDRKIVEDRIT